LPFYARLAAVLRPVMPDVCTQLCNQIDDQIHSYIHTADKSGKSIDSKMKAIKFAGELTKFGALPVASALRIMQVCLRH
jgi:regulator of nonsense transcripts 2